MPRFPQVDPQIAAMRGGVFSRLAHRIAALQGGGYPLHVGDTWMEPVQGARMEDLHDLPGVHRYSAPHGHPALLRALAERHGVDIERVLVTAGATGALSSIASSTLSPGDEVLILSPYWPLIPGVVRAARACPVEVPLLGGTASLRARLEARISGATAALYVNSPHNPTGRVFTEAECAELAAVARENGLWIWSDEVYAPFAYARPHRSLAEHAPERTFTVGSASKAYGMAGNRCGWVVGPAEGGVMAELRKVATHSFYAAPTASQVAAARALESGADWVRQARAAYEAAGRAAAVALGQPAPEGGTFLFIDVADVLDERGLDGLLSDCVEEGLVLAPGPSCGADYPTYVRLCFTSAPPEVVAAGVTVLRGILERKRGRVS